VALFGRNARNKLAQQGYTTTVEGDATFLWHPDYDEGMTAIGWAIKDWPGSWSVFVRNMSIRLGGQGELIGHRASLDEALVAIANWGIEYRHLAP
jgi:hypothetical protein